MSTPFRNRVKKPVFLYEIEGFSVNVLEGEDHNRTSIMTEFTVEDGSIVSDHIIHKPQEVVIRCVQTNVSSVTNRSGYDMAVEALAQLEGLWKSREVFDLYTYHAVYNDMVVMNFTANHNQPFRGALRFTITLRKVNFVTLATSTRVNAEPEVKAIEEQQNVGTIPVQRTGSVILTR